MIRCIAIDMDDTLLMDDLTVSPENRRALSGAMQKGVKVILASGRMIQSMRPYARQLELSSPMIAYNGALIHDPSTDQVIDQQLIPLDVARRVAALFQKADVHCNAYQNDQVYMDKITEWAKAYAANAGVIPYPVGNLVDFLTESTPKMLGIGVAETMERMQTLLKEQFAGLVDSTPSKKNYLEILASGVSKGRALQKLAQRWGMDRSEFMAIGDGLNDLEMIRWAGLGVAIGNAAPQLKEAADYVVADHNHHGVADAIQLAM